MARTLYQQIGDAREEAGELINIGLAYAENAQPEKALSHYEQALEFFQKTENNELQLIDAETGSTWNFEGKATGGPLRGRELKKVFVLEDYWFDWRIYHPDTTIYTLG